MFVHLGLISIGMLLRMLGIDLREISRISWTMCYSAFVHMSAPGPVYIPNTSKDI